jgi:hypothetical protein
MCRRTLLLIAALAVSGCVTNQTMVWDHPTKDTAAFKADRFECLKTADTANPPAVGVGQDPLGFGPYTYDVNQDNRTQLFSACMNAKGWVFQQAPVAPAQPSQTP